MKKILDTHSFLIKSLSSVIFVVALVMASIMARYWAFTQTAFANGWDSYFYLVQIKSMEETGMMHSPEGSLIYPFLRLFYWCTHDYVSAIKWATAVLCGVWTAIMCCLPRSRQMGFLLGAWSVFSPQLTYFAAEYPKNMLGLVLLGVFIAVLEHGGKHKLILGFIVLTINYFGHRMTFGLSLVYGVLSALFQWGKTSIPSLLSRRSIALAGVVLALIVIAGAMIPGLGRVSDFHRLAGAISWRPQFAPWSFVTSFGPEKISGYWFFELAVVVILFLLQIVQGGRMMWNRRLNVHLDLPLLTLCVVLLFPFLEWTFLGVSWRFFLVFVLIAPILLHKSAFHQRYWYAIPALLIASFFSWKSYDPKLQDPNYALFSRVTRNVEKQFEQLPKPELVIAHNALAEYFTFSTGIDAMPWLPEYDIDSMRLWRIANGVRYESLGYYAREAGREQVKILGGGYFLLPEYCWQMACRNAATEQDTFFVAGAKSWRNPHQTRPVWLLRNRNRKN